MFIINHVTEKVNKNPLDYYIGVDYNRYKGVDYMAKFCCEQCAYYDYDEEYDEYYCSVNLDEDEMEKYMSGNTDSCHYFTLYDEYKVVRKQN